MEYVQMTLNDWLEIKQKLRQELLGVKQSFVRIGYMLRKIDDQKRYEQDGYKSIAEFAQKELGLHPSTTTRFMEINREYSIDGYSERLRPEYLDLGRSQLEEMLKLQDSDRAMIQPETSRESIRELKRFNNAGPAEGADDLTELLIKFYKDNPDTLNGIFLGNLETEDIGRIKELVNPSGNRSYKMGLFFLMFYENKISVKKFGQPPQNMTWEKFLERTRDIFGEVAAGAKTWNNYFGGEEDGAGTDVKENIKIERDTEETTVEEPGETDGAPEDGNKREETGKESHEKLPGRNESKEAIAPAQKVPEILEETGENDDKKEEGNRTSEADSEELEVEEETTEETTESSVEVMNASEVIEKPFGSRKDYMDTLTAYGMACYLTDEYKRHNLKASSLAFPTELEKWLNEEVDAKGLSIECE